ncbi:MAG: DsrE family protein [Saonia sp.]
MKKKSGLLFAFFLVCTYVVVFSQEKEAGPIIKDFGKVFKIEDADILVDPAKDYKVVFDIMNTPEGNDKINASIETAARFLNMHAQHGVPAEQLSVALVVHNKASKDIITNGAYKQRFGVDNPNTKLIEALVAANVQVIFCGQSSKSRGFPKEDLIPGVKLSLSAMTSLLQLQDENYKLIKF